MSKLINEDELLSKGTSHPSFVAFVIHFLDRDEFLGISQEDDYMEKTIFSMIPDFAVHYKSYRLAEISSLRLERPHEICYLFDIDNLHYVSPYNQ